MSLLIYGLIQILSRDHRAARPRGSGPELDGLSSLSRRPMDTTSFGPIVDGRHTYFGSTGGFFCRERQTGPLQRIGMGGCSTDLGLG